MHTIFDKDVINEDDIKQIISNKFEESIDLDFKKADSLGNTDGKKAEISKDVSSFANSAGGIIIYGIVEENHIASSLSFVNGNEYTKEWLEQVIQSRIQRKIENLKIFPVRIDDDIEKTIYVVKIPESPLAPHMASDKRFYKRYNFKSERMEEYEIRNLFNRKSKTKLSIHNIITISTPEVENEGEHNEIIYNSLGFQIENISRSIEKDYKLIIYINTRGYHLKYNELAHPKPNISLSDDENGIISFPSISTIFPDEILTIGKIDFGIERKDFEKVFEKGKLKLRLLYTNGIDEWEIPIREIIKTNT